MIAERFQFTLAPEEQIVRSAAANGVFDTIMSGPLGRWVADGRRAMSAIDQRSIESLIDEVDLVRDEIGRLPWREIREDLKSCLEDFVLTMRSLSWTDRPEVVAAIADLSVGSLEAVVDRLIDLSSNPMFGGAESRDWWDDDTDGDDDEVVLDCDEDLEFADSLYE
jgi:hypothetical protein